MTYSNCCWAPANRFSENSGLCPECFEHCDFLSEEEWEEQEREEQGNA